MADNTGIEWTNATWNPVAGCSNVSEGCRNCYARGMTRRLEAMGSAKYTGLTVMQGSHAVWTGKISFDEEMLLQPLRWKRPRRIFVNSMSDLFHEKVTDGMRDRIFAVMALAPQHTFQVLTKRSERMLTYLTGHGRTSLVYNAATPLINGEWSRMSKQMAHHRSSGEGWWPLPNVWLGVSVENQQTADERIPLLLQTPAAVRFLSCEPLLGPVDLFSVPRRDVAYFQVRGESGAIGLKTEPDDYVHACKSLLHWVIAGGESGPHSRPMHPDWARGLRDQCASAGVPYFFKQWGAWKPIVDRDNDDPDWRLNYLRYQHDDAFAFLNLAGGCGFHGARLHVCQRVGRKAAGHLLDGVEHHAFPEVR